MSNRLIATGLGLALVLAVPALAGEAGKCSHDAQVCLNYMAQHMQGRGWAGVELDESGEAMTVTKVYDKTPAARAGLQVGDRLVAVNGLRLADKDEEAMHAMMAEMKPGKTFTYTLARSGKEREVRITLETMPEEAIYRMVGQHMLRGHATVEVASN